jgi:hypothetical protein
MLEGSITEKNAQTKSSNESRDKQSCPKGSSKYLLRVQKDIVYLLKDMETYYLDDHSGE